MATRFPASVVAVVAVLATTAANVAYAERRPVAVISLTGERDATDLADNLFRTLVDHPDLQPLKSSDLSSALKGDLVDEFQIDLQVARTARADADQALGLAQPQFPSAATAAVRGLNALTRVAPSPEMLQIYADLMFDLGVAQLGQGKNVDASRSFALVRRLDPTRKADRARYVAEIADAYDATANARVAKSPLNVKGMGTVWIDGVALGETPHKELVDDGVHLVQLTGPDREPRGEQVFVPQTAEVEIAPALATEELKVKRARIELVNAQDSLTRASAVKRLAALLSVSDAVIISKSSGGALLIQTWRDNEQGFSAIQEHATEDPAKLLYPLAPPRPVENKKPPIEIKKPPIVIVKPWHQKTWVRASAATGVLAIIVTAVLIARRDPMVDFGSGDVKPADSK